MAKHTQTTTIDLDSAARALLGKIQACSQVRSKAAVIRALIREHAHFLDMQEEARRRGHHLRLVAVVEGSEQTLETLVDRLDFQL